MPKGKRASSGGPQQPPPPGKDALTFRGAPGVERASKVQLIGRGEGEIPEVPEPESALGVVIRVFRAKVNTFDNRRGKHESRAYCIYQADVQPLKSHKAKRERGRQLSRVQTKGFNG